VLFREGSVEHPTSSPRTVTERRHAAAERRQEERARRQADVVVSVSPCREQETDGLQPHQRETSVAPHVRADSQAFERAVLCAPHVRRQRPYRLLFDLRWMTIGSAGGLEQMSYELVDAISRIDHQNEYRIHCPRSTYCEWHFPRAFRCRPVFSGPAEARGEGTWARLTNALCRDLGRPAMLTPEMRSLRRLATMDFDVVHSVSSYSFPEMRPFPNVLTVADLQHVHYPEFFSAEEWRGRDHVYRESCAHATHIVCMSEFTRQDLHRSYGIPLERMTTIWNIPSRAAWLPISPERRSDLLAAMDLRGPYLFFPAHSWPHKNHARLVEAFSVAVEGLPPNLDLVFVGRAFDEGHPAARLVHDRRLEQRVRHLGYRSPLEMRALYASAHALVFPSLFEGFGMPIVEAMIAGCPVACAAATSLPEIAGPAARLFDPLDIEDIARAIVDVAVDGEIRRELLAQGQRRRRLFAGKRIALETIAVYRRTLDGFYD
jgi:glycosyltransferase involved in cell wall biosynthesis